MDELLYIWSLGFSPADTSRALTIALLVSLMMTEKSVIWRQALLALAIDRAYPIIMMAISGDRASDVVQTVTASMTTLGSDLGVLTIRYVVIFTVISFAYNLRTKLQKKMA
ncbi:MAG: hypothetical protein AAFR11_03705 [Pseudomonadota bacterium]